MRKCSSEGVSKLYTLAHPFAYLRGGIQTTVVTATMSPPQRVSTF